MKISRRKFGSRGEEIARDYLVARGYTIDALNWRKSRYEIDIVARKDDVLAFIEVKSSRSDLLGPPEMKVNKAKQKRIAEAAAEYISELDNLPDNIRFDVISILWRPDDKPEIRHIESAYTLEEDF